MIFPSLDFYLPNMITTQLTYTGQERLILSHVCMFGSTSLGTSRIDTSLTVLPVNNTWNGRDTLQEKIHI